MRQPKKTTKKKLIEYKPSIEDVLRNQVNLYQYCQELSSKVRDMEFQMQNLDFQNQMIKRETLDVKTLLHNLGNHLKQMHEKEEASRSDTPMPSEGSKTEEKAPMVKKALPLHDDVMMNCEVCGRNHHINLSCCPGCGYKRAKGER